jgi:hypothetical protein
MDTLPRFALPQVAETLFRALQGAGEQRSEYFRNRIVPFVKRIWPKAHDAKTPAASSAFVKLCTAAGDAFPEALTLLKNWIQPINDVSYLLRLMHEGRLCSRFPDEAITLLDLFIPPTITWGLDELKLCLGAIRTANQDLERDRRFQRLVTLLRQAGQWP